jgi:hypothetical protein
METDKYITLPYSILHINTYTEPPKSFALIVTTAAPNHTITKIPVNIDTD